MTSFIEAIAAFLAADQNSSMRCYRLLSWWDMERFSAATFQQIVTGLVAMRANIEEGLPPETDASGLAAKYIPTVELVRAECEKIGLKTSVICADEFIALASGMTVGDLVGSLKEIENTIRREMQGCLFLHMPFKGVAYYDQPQAFGARVAVRLPSLEYDIREAGNCYATGRSTACVFHLMRIMEVGVQRLGEMLGVALVEEKNWQVILDQVNKAVKSLPAKEPRTVALSQVSAHLYNVKKEASLHFPANRVLYLF